MTHGDLSSKQHAMAQFGEGNFTDLPAIYQPHKHVDARLCQGRLRVEVDFYSESGAAEAAGDEWDVDQWEREQIVLEGPPGRECWYGCWQAARALLRGHRVHLHDGTVLSREAHLAEARVA